MYLENRQFLAPVAAPLTALKSPEQMTRSLNGVQFLYSLTLGHVATEKGD
jgi:hypothetical protein